LGRGRQVNKPYQRRWTVRLRGQVLGTVPGATHAAACLRAIRRFNVSRGDQSELEVERETTSGDLRPGRPVTRPR
jgi:hypothetical protein